MRERIVYVSLRARGKSANLTNSTNWSKLRAKCSRPFVLKTIDLQERPHENERKKKGKIAISAQRHKRLNGQLAANCAWKELVDLTCKIYALDVSTQRRETCILILRRSPVPLATHTPAHRLFFPVMGTKEGNQHPGIKLDLFTLLNEREEEREKKRDRQ